MSPWHPSSFLRTPSLLSVVTNLILEVDAGENFKGRLSSQVLPWSAPCLQPDLWSHLPANLRPCAFPDDRSIVPESIRQLSHLMVDPAVREEFVGAIRVALHAAASHNAPPRKVRAAQDFINPPENKTLPSLYGFNVAVGGGEVD